MKKILIGFIVLLFGIGVLCSDGWNNGVFEADIQINQIDVADDSDQKVVFDMDITSNTAEDSIASYSFAVDGSPALDIGGVSNAAGSYKHKVVKAGKSTDIEFEGRFISYGGDGDYNNSDLTNSSDASGWLTWYNNIDTLSFEQIKEYDINGDGFLNVYDYWAFLNLAGQTLEVPIDKYTKKSAWQAASRKLLPSTNGIITGQIGFGSILTAYSTIDSTDAKELQTICDYADSVTTGTDVIYLWKDGKRADITFSTP